MISGLELAFSYVTKKPNLYDSLFKTLAGAFTFSYDEERYGFYRHKQLVNFLVENTNPKKPIYLRMFFDLFSHLMKSSNQAFSNSWKRDTISFYTYHLPLNRYSKEIRRKIWAHANKFYLKDIPESEEEIFKYIDSIRQLDKEILDYDLKYLLNLIKKNFSNRGFIYCYYIQELISKSIRSGIEHPDFTALKESFYSWEYKIYKLIDMSSLRNREEHEYTTVDFDKFERIKETEDRYKLKFESASQFEKFYKTFCDIATVRHIQSWNFNNALDIIIHETYLLNKNLAFTFLQIIQQKQNQTQFIPNKTFRAIIHQKTRAFL